MSMNRHETDCYLSFLAGFALATVALLGLLHLTGGI